MCNGKNIFLAILFASFSSVIIADEKNKEEVANCLNVNAVYAEYLKKNNSEESLEKILKISNYFLDLANKYYGEGGFEEARRVVVQRTLNAEIDNIKSQFKGCTAHYKELQSLIEARSIDDSNKEFASKIKAEARLAAEAKADNEAKAMAERRAAEVARNKPPTVGGTLQNSSVTSKSQSIQSCNEFLQRWLNGYEFAKSYFRYECAPTNENGAAFVINGKPGTLNNDQWFYYPDKDIVVWIDRNNTRKVLNSKTFVDDSQKPPSMNDEGDIEIKKLPANQALQVCRNITAAYNNIITDHQFRWVAGYEVAEIAKRGGWDFEIVARNNMCLIAFDVKGIYQGNSYSKRVTCGVRVVSKNSQGKYTAKWLAIGGGFDEGCRAN